MHEKDDKFIQNLVGKPEGKRSQNIDTAVMMI